MTELALIPPMSCLDETLATTHHMLLAHLCSDHKYVNFYAGRRVHNEFLILDNGAFELGVSTGAMPMLLAYTWELQCQEVVAPDSIMDSKGTYARALEAAAWLASPTGAFAWKRAGSPRLMIVPQVDPNDEFDRYEEEARLLLDVYHTSVPYLHGHFTLGVSKNHDQLHGGWLLLFREVIQALRRDYPQIQVHCLGLPKRWDKVKKVLKENPWIRSVDTALPFVAALHNIELQHYKDHLDLPKRPVNYFARELTDEQRVLAQVNAAWLSDQVTLRTSGAL